MHLANASAAGWQCLLVVCGSFENLLLPAHDSTASTAYSMSAALHSGHLCCFVTVGDAQQSFLRPRSHLQLGIIHALCTMLLQLAEACTPTAMTH